MCPFNSPETLSFLLLPLLLVVLELLLLLLCGCVPFGLCFTRARPVGDSVTVLAAVEEEDDEDVSERFEEALITSPGDTTGRPFLIRAVVTSLGATPAALSSSLATLGPTVITVGRSRVNAKVEPGRGSRYGGGLLDFIVVTCVGRSGG